MRSRLPLGELAQVDLGADRADPVALLEQQAASRVPELVPIRYGRMLTSPFAFYRGAASIMASDLARGPHSGLTVQLCGDAHLSNFGVFGSPERRLIFDLNDFDETLPGPFEWDVKRLAASLEVAGRANGFSKKQRRAVVRWAGACYREAMRDFAGRGNLEVWYARMDMDEVMADLGPRLKSDRRKATEAALAKARTRDSMHAFSRLVRIEDGHPRIVSDPPLIVPVEDLLPQAGADELYAALRDVLRAYRRSLQSDRKQLLEQFELVHMARKVVGVGSVGTRAWILLMRGVDDGDPMILQAKEAQASVLEAFLPSSQHRNHGQRVVSGQRLMQASSDIFLGWQSTPGVDGVLRDYYLRQLKDWKLSVDTTTMAPVGMQIYARLCAWTLARAHARSGDRVAIASYLGAKATFDDAITEFAVAYADQNDRDSAALSQAARDGRIVAEHGR